SQLVGRREDASHIAEDLCDEPVEGRRELSVMVGVLPQVEEIRIPLLPLRRVGAPTLRDEPLEGSQVPAGSSDGGLRLQPRLGLRIGLWLRFRLARLELRRTRLELRLAPLELPLPLRQLLCAPSAGGKLLLLTPPEVVLTGRELTRAPSERQLALRHSGAARLQALFELRIHPHHPRSRSQRGGDRDAGDQSSDTG